MNRKHNAVGVLRLTLFLLAFGILLGFANLNFIETDLISGATVLELQSREDIDIAFVGSSVTVYHFNPEIITAETGLTSYNAAIHSNALQGDIAIAEELFKTSSPKYVVLVLEPYDLNTAKENMEAEYRMIPFLSGIDTKLRYYKNNVDVDHEYVERALVLRSMYPHSLRSILKTLDTKRDYKAALEKYADRLDPDEQYMGAGYIRHRPNPKGFAESMRIQMYRDEYEGNYYPLIPETCELLTQFRELCSAHDAELLFVICANHTCHALAEPYFLPYTQSLMNYCADDGIVCFNFQYAKPEFMPCLDNHFFDIYHMDEEGSDLLTEAFCKVFKLWQAGETFDDLFYTNSWMYLDTLHALTNTWLWPEKGHLLADCNIDKHSVPEYKFTSRTADGTETLLRDYSEDPVIDADVPEGGNIRVYARIKGEEQNPETYYDYPDDFAFASKFIDFDEE